MVQKFNLTRDRSAVSGRYLFKFIGNSQKAVAPVLQKYQTGEYRLIGTSSCFIKPNLFITASHIFDGDDNNTDDGFYIIYDTNPEPLLITHIYKYEALDLAMFQIDLNYSEQLEEIKPLAVMNLPPEKSEVVATFGFSHTVIDPKDTFKIESRDAIMRYAMHIISGN